jgi:hypothetical protein
MLEGVSRGEIKCAVDGKTISIYGEWFQPKGERPVFWVSREMIKKWDPPFNDQPLTDDERQAILDYFVLEMEKKWNAIVEIA